MPSCCMVLSCPFDVICQLLLIHVLCQCVRYVVLTFYLPDLNLTCVNFVLQPKLVQLNVHDTS